MTAIIEFWNMLPQDTRSFIISVAASITSRMISGKKIDSRIEKELQAAFEEGFKYFTPNFGDNCSYFIKDLLAKEDTQKLFIKFVKNENFSENKQLLKEALFDTGIEIDTIDGFDIDIAVQSFLEGFTAKAEKSEALLQLLHLQELRKVVALLQKQQPLTDLNILRKKYLKYLKEKYSYMSFKGLSEGKLISIPLKDLYTGLVFTKEHGEYKDQHFQKRSKTTVDEQPYQLKDVQISDILDSRFAVITGDPGAGKSTLLKYIALAFAEGKGKERINVDMELIPMLFPIAAFADASKKADSISYSFDRFILEYFQGTNLPDLSPLINDAIEKKKAIFLLDGLDEVADETERKKMVEKIREFIISKSDTHNRFLITCRIASYTRSTRLEPIHNRAFVQYNVSPFNDLQIGAFLLSWFRWYHLEMHKRFEILEIEAKKSQKKMLDVIQGDENIRSIATNPLMLTILSLIEHEGGSLPKDRAELYAKCLSMLAGGWERLRSLYEKENIDFKLGGRKLDTDFIIEFLGPIAMEMHEKASPDIEYFDLKTKLAKKFDQRNRDFLLSKQQADDFIKIMKEQSGIIEEISTGKYNFRHQTFREYLAARVLAELSEDRISDLGANLTRPEWREVVFLTAATLSKQYASRFVKEIMDASPKESIFLAGECVIDVGRNKIFDNVYDDLIGKLNDIAFGNYPVKEKAIAGEILGWLGDTRDLKEFVRIEGGEYELEDIGKVKIATFEIMKYAVVNTWFEEFINAGGYKTREYWSLEGRKWLEHTKDEKPRFWDERKWRCPNSPVVGVCWYEAYAFTRWLNAIQNDGYSYRLITEKEWQAAAAGKEGRNYPWGNEWDKNKCNNYEIKIEKTSPAGIFKRGNTPDGISDLSGNVWEWTHTDYDSKIDLNDFKQESKEDLQQWPVLRGGSWGDRGDDCRCAYRSGFDPGFRSDYVGFRCARTVTL